MTVGIGKFLKFLTHFIPQSQKLLLFFLFFKILLYNTVFPCFFFFFKSCVSILTISTHTSSSVGSELPIAQNVFLPPEEAREKLSRKLASFQIYPRHN